MDLLKNSKRSAEKQPNDEEIMFGVVLKSLLKKSSPKTLARQDVVVKTIFRIYRSFYKQKLELFWGKKRKGVPRSEIVGTLDKFAQNFLLGVPDAFLP